MQQSRVWFIFLSALTLITIVFGVQAFIKLMAYKNLSEHTPVQVTDWKVEGRKNGTYAVIANYFFDFRGRTYHGTSLVHSVYKNPWAAEKAQAVFEKTTWAAWVDPNYPVHSTIYKSFPVKNVLSAVALAGVLLYFLCIRLFFGVRDGHRIH